MIKFALNINNLKLITSKEFTLNPGEIALYKFSSDKIKMDFISNLYNFTMFYYLDYISEENGIKNDNLLLLPELFKKKVLFPGFSIFEISPNLTRAKTDPKNKNNLFLYLIFSFNVRMTIKEPKEGNSFNYSYLLIGILVVLFLAIIIVPYIVKYCRNKKKKNIIN